MSILLSIYMYNMLMISRYNVYHVHHLSLACYGEADGNVISFSGILVLDKLDF